MEGCIQNNEFGDIIVVWKVQKKIYYMKINMLNNVKQEKMKNMISVLHLLDILINSIIVIKDI